MMQNRIILSIVAPVFGVEHYIRQWLDSVLNQDLPDTDYEVVCVNDCTKDRSAEIIREYQKNHSNLILLNHTENKKDNAARNTGFRAARGKYVWFNDPDDIIAPNSIKKIVETMEQYSLDMLHWSIETTSGQCVCTLSDKPVMSGVELLLSTARTLEFDITYTWNRCYRRQMLLDANIFFREERGCDVLQTLQAIDAAKRCMDVRECYYFYRSDNPTNYSHTDRDKAWRMMAYSFRLGKYVYELQVDPRIQPLYKDAGIWRINQVKKTLLRMPLSELSLVYRMLSQDSELYAFILSNANQFVRFELSHPLITKMINGCIYSPMVLVRNMFNNFKHK